MKLYTEEQIAKAVMFGRWGGTMKKDYEQFLNKITPIELQSDATSSQTEISDDEIKKALHNAWCHYEYDDGNLYSTTFRDGWLMAIEWYREQLKKKQ